MGSLIFVYKDRSFPSKAPHCAAPTSIEPGNTNCGGGLSTVDLLIKVACSVKKEINIFNIKMR
jgi:hypothetical protein